MPSGESLATSGASAGRPKSSTGAKGCGGGHLPFESRGKQELFPPLGILGEAARSAGAAPGGQSTGAGQSCLLPRAFKRLRSTSSPCPALPNPKTAPGSCSGCRPGLALSHAVPRAPRPGPCGVPPPRPAGGPGAAVAPPDLALLAAVALAHPAPRGSSGAAPGVSPLRTRGPGELAGEGSQAQLSAPWGASSPPAPGLLLIPERRARKEPRDAAAELPGHVPGVLASRGRDERGSRGAQGRRPPS